MRISYYYFFQVAVGNESAQGVGANKKLAKRAAAENMLQLLGYSRPPPQPGKPVLKTDGSSHSDPDKTRKVTFLEDTTTSDNAPSSSQASQGGGVQHAQTSQSSVNSSSIPPGGSGRQLVPGLIMMPDGSALHGYQSVQQQSGNSG